MAGFLPKPPVLVLNTSHQLSVGLGFFAPLNELGPSGGFVDLVSGALGVATGLVGADFVTGEVGPAVSLSGTKEIRWKAALTPELHQELANNATGRYGITFAGLYRITTATGGTQVPIVGIGTHNNNTAPNQEGGSVGFGSNFVAGQVYTQGNARGQATGTTGFTTTRFRLIVWSYQDITAGGGLGGKLWEPGSTGSLGSLGGGGSARIPTLSDVILGTQNISAGVAQLAAAWIWTRNLTKAEVEIFGADPWQMARVVDDGASSILVANNPIPLPWTSTADKIAAESWQVEIAPTRQTMFTLPRIDAPSPVNPNLATDRLAAETWAIDYGAARRPMFTAPRVDNPPPIQPLSASDRAAAESWNAEEVRMGRRPALALDAAVVSPPPRAAPPLTAAATWVPDEVVPRPGPRLVQSVDAPTPRGSIASAWTAIESWGVELVRAARVAATDGAHDAPPPYVSRAGSPAATWSPDEQTRARAPVVPQPPAAAQQVPPARSQAAAAQAWDAPEAPPPARARFPAPSVDATPPRTPFARAAVDTWMPEEVRPRPPFAPQLTGSQVDNPPPRGPLATIRASIETWLIEYGATRRTTFTDGQRDAPPPRTPFARAAADTWAPLEDQRPRSAPAPQVSVQADNPPPRGLVATARAAVETWLTDYGSVRRPTYTDGQRDQPAPRVPFARAAADSWEPPDTRLPPRYQPQLPTTVNQPPPIGAINTLRAALETWWVSFGWTRPPSFTAPKVDSPPPAATRMGWAAAATWAPDDAQPTTKRTAPPAAPAPDAPPPQASRNAGSAAETWAPVETPRLRAPSAPQASAQVPPASRPSLGAVIESWVAEAVAARRPPAVVPGSVDAPPPRSAAARAVAVAETWLTELVGLRSRTVVPAGVAPPAPTGNRNTARAAETWTMEGAWVRRPTAPIPPPQVDQPPLSGAKVVRNIAQATWEYVEYARSTWRTIADLAFAWLPAWLVAHPGRSRAYSDVDSQGRPRSYSIVDLSRTDSTTDPSRTYSIVQKTRTED